MPLKILTVDDSRTVRIIIRNTFKRFDCEIVEAGNGAEGLEKIKEKPDLVLLDITMPIMDGVAMLERMQADPALKEIPVVMLTAEGQKAMAERAASLGSRGYVMKPFTGDTLIQHIAGIVTLQEKAVAAA